jgi:prepilin-type N-terminal cleavage/methylation domain-containing protein
MMKRGRSGFTLLEVIVAAALILALVGAMASFLSDALRIRTRVSEEVERARAGDVAIATIERALETAIVEDPRLGAGVVGDATSLSVLRIGLSSWRLGTFDRARALEEADRVRIRFDAATGRILVTRGDAPESALGGSIARLRLRYFDGQAWSSSFDSVRAGQLPAAVEIALWLRPNATPDQPVERPEFDLEASDAVDADDPDSGSDAIPPDRLRIVAIPDAGPEIDAAFGSASAAERGGS